MIEQRHVPTDVFTELAEVGRFAAVRSWVPATSGNFSRRIDARTIAMTRSGVDKGALCESDIIAVALGAALPAGVSAETPLHVARYLANPAIGAIVHVHTLAATVLSKSAVADGVLTIQGYEMQKAFDGIATHEATIRIPVFANAQDTQELATSIEARLGASALPGYLLAGHGLYAWGATMRDARRHLEGFEFLLQCALEERRRQP